LWFQLEKKSKEFELGLDAQKCFSQMHEDRNMNEGIGGQMMKLDPVVMQESRKERRAWKPQSSFQEGGESNNFTRIFIRMIFTQGWTPLDNRSGNQKTMRNQSFKVRLGTLTCVPAFLTGWLCSHTLPLGRLLGSHPEINRSFHAHTMAETLGREWE